MKRLIDLIISSLSLIILGPIILLVALIVRIKLGSPVLFKQLRPGLYGEPFLIYKFRTMTDARDSRGNLLPDELRLPPIGMFLRKYSLDELPQLLNVLKGELSLVGPRPLAMEYLPLYSTFQARRHEVKPGITGWAQVNGRNAISWDKRFELDVWYVENRTLFLDFKILIMTLIRVVRNEGISQDGHVTMPDFEGTKRAQRK